MIRLLTFLWAAVAALGLTVRAATAALPKEVDDFFKWGEYDSLEARLEPFLTALPGGAGQADSATLAKANLYAGVAYYANGQSAKSDSAFIRACRYENGIKLDRFYVSNEIATRFEALALEQEKRRKKPLQVLAVPPAPPRGKSSSQPLKRAPGPSGKAWIWVGSGALIAATAVTAYYFLSQKPPPNEVTTTVPIP